MSVKTTPKRKIQYIEKTCDDVPSPEKILKDFKLRNCQEALEDFHYNRKWKYSPAYILHVSAQHSKSRLNKDNSDEAKIASALKTLNNKLIEKQKYPEYVQKQHSISKKIVSLRLKDPVLREKLETARKKNLEERNLKRQKLFEKCRASARKRGYKEVTESGVFIQENFSDVLEEAGE